MNEPRIEPRAITMTDWESGPDTIVPGAEITNISNVEVFYAAWN